MMNLRAHRREITLKTARIISATSGPMPCAVLNMSADGACLLVAEPEYVNQEFDLVIDHNGNRHLCFVAWRAGHRVGVRFLNSDQQLAIA